VRRYLCISVTLLDSLFHGKGDGDEPEWPPSPMRLFQALLAGSRIGCRGRGWSEAKRAAFLWLECREPPLIVGAEAQRSAAYTLFVPNNDADREFERQDRLTSKVVRPHRIDSSASEASNRPALHYLWPIQESEWIGAKAHLDFLCREAQHLMALGWGIDQAVACGRVLSEEEVARLRGRRWRAWRAHRPGQNGLRVPTEGSLKDLERVHESFRLRIGNQFEPHRRFRQFERVIYLSASTVPARSYAAFELPEGVAFRHEEAAVVAAMLRSLACQCAKLDSHVFPGGSEVYVAGHISESTADRNGTTPPRFSYVPLPTIGHRHADGMVRRVMVVESLGGDGSHAEWAQERLRNQTLRDINGRDRGALLDLWRTSSPAMTGLYVAESRVWASVTPVILPGLDDGRQAKAERLFLKAAAQAEIPLEAIECVTLRKAPFWSGSAHPRNYVVPEYLRRFSRWHVAVRFREPMPGPLVIGAGRHVGLGLLAALH
jgi:CRISPR-associated protein Csb2